VCVCVCFDFERVILFVCDSRLQNIFATARLGFVRLMICSFIHDTLDKYKKYFIIKRRDFKFY